MFNRLNENKVKVRPPLPQVLKQAKDEAGEVVRWLKPILLLHRAQLVSQHPHLVATYNSRSRGPDALF